MQLTLISRVKAAAGLRRILLSLAAIAAVVSLGAGAAQAQASRTWVSGVGDDANPCSRTAPRKTFAGAISKTAAGGEIDCLDSAGYGALTITKGITVNCLGVIGSVLVSGTNGIVVQADRRTSSIFAVLRSTASAPGSTAFAFFPARLWWSTTATSTASRQMALTSL